MWFQEHITHYNIPSNNRELQLFFLFMEKKSIITYQVITGNYSIKQKLGIYAAIITYQVITGNYSVVLFQS